MYSTLSVHDLYDALYVSPLMKQYVQHGCQNSGPCANSHISLTYAIHCTFVRKTGRLFGPYFSGRSVNGDSVSATTVLQSIELECAGVEADMYGKDDRK